MSSSFTLPLTAEKGILDVQDWHISSVATHIIATSELIDMIIILIKRLRFALTNRPHDDNHTLLLTSH